jgi:hypothetical protein
MKILVSCDRVVWLSQIPDLQARVLIVIISNHELCRNFRVPCHACLSKNRLLALSLRWSFITTKVIKIVVILCHLLRWLCEVEY